MLWSDFHVVGPFFSPVLEVCLKATHSGAISLNVNEALQDAEHSTSNDTITAHFQTEYKCIYIVQ